MDPRFLGIDGNVRRGVRRVIQVAQPAAGAEWGVVVPAGVNWRVLTGLWVFTTSAAVANRVAAVQLTVDGTIVWRGGNAGSYVASAAVAVSIMCSDSPAFNAGANNPTSQAFPGIPLPPGAVVGSRTGGMDAGDQYSAIVLWIEEFYMTDQSLSIAHEEHEHEREHEREAIAAALGTTPQQLLTPGA